ncbi:allantoicase [Streptomyces sp. TS71-3]|uniref:allantoicase n=1 Tax=Streptomyces sp. TS71-3 TaxID=2733862 RepID=UPI001B292B6F|nr:allantoicase [Streptomyces sp. TS71-3]GHJ41142.1 putative allantoicase [Streptomyces sp. TS71-3]
MTDLPRFTGPAAPYAGGDPYADYRTADFPFTGLPDLADRALGAGVVAADDEFFAPRESLLLPGRPVFEPDRFGPKGKIMDGWETRRRRGSADHPWPRDGDHDWALVRLGAPGVIHGVVVDTAHFRGNHPEAVSVEGACADGTPDPGELLGAGTAWHTLVPRTAVGGHAANGFAVAVRRRFTHLRLRQYPDGGIARLRVHGEVVPDVDWLTALGTFDVLALEHGGRVTGASDLFYSPAAHTIAPGRSRRMDDGWETRRRRDRGHDWIGYRLAAHARVHAVEIDTAYLKGNAAGWASLSVLDAGSTGSAGSAGSVGSVGSVDDEDPGGSGPDLAPGAAGAGAWTQALPRTRLQPDTVHRFVLPEPVTGTHARIDIYPDGGISRLRLFGSLTERGVRRLRERRAELGG